MKSGSYGTAIMMEKVKKLKNAPVAEILENLVSALKIHLDGMTGVIGRIKKLESAVSEFEAMKREIVKELGDEAAEREKRKDSPIILLGPGGGGRP